MFYADDPNVELMTPERSTAQAEPGTAEAAQVEAEAGPSEPPFSDQDPNSASIRIDLSGIGAHNRENPSD